MHALLFASLLLLLPAGLLADVFNVEQGDTEISVQRLPAEGELLAILLVDHDEPRPDFERLLQSMPAAGIELWRVDLLDAYFLPRGGEAERTLSGDGVAAVLQAAVERSDKPILLIAYDRLPLAALRGVRLWQQQGRASERLAGLVLLYPNLFGPAPVAGEDPVLDPVVSATNVPLVIYQPELGALRWRLNEVTDALWQAGSPAFVHWVPDARDWFIMGDEDHGPGAPAAARALPQQLTAYARLLSSFEVPNKAARIVQRQQDGDPIQTLVRFDRSRAMPAFEVCDIEGRSHRLSDSDGRVRLVNFWATWCPPCVEEIPSINRLQARYADKDFEVISIDYRESPAQIREFMQQVPVEFPVLLDGDGKVALDWKVFSFPSTFLIDRRGRLRYSANRAIDWNSAEVWSAIDQLLAEP